MSKVKSLWATPQLIVLARGMPEESVLLHCKTNNDHVVNPAGPKDQVTHQDCSSAETGNCSACQARAYGS